MSDTLPPAALTVATVSNSHNFEAGGFFPCMKTKYFAPDIESFFYNTDRVLSPEEIELANIRHDNEKHAVSMSLESRYGNPSWRRAPTTGLLTDRKIESYLAKGFYSAEFKQARKEHMENRNKRKNARREIYGSKVTRDGNWLVREDGSRIWSPLSQ